MKIEVIEPIGYCSGVNRAISLAIKARKDNPNKNIYILGQLVHNHHVSDYLKRLNIVTLSQKINESLIDNLKKEDIVIFTAHGHDKKYDELLILKGISFVDATCPIVKNNMSIISYEIKGGHQVVYIGKKDHPETLAALSINKQVVPYYGDSFDYAMLSDDSPLVINQTTLNVDELKKIYEAILSHYPKARIATEVCNTTKLRQRAVKDISKDVDIIYIVGDKNSSNTLRLFEVAKEYHKGINVELISSLEDINIGTLKNKKHLAISSGASTPLELINDIVSFLSNYNW